MGLFDFFRKKDAATYLERAQKDLAARRWVGARDEAREGLDLTVPTPVVKDALEKVLLQACENLCEMNLEEARVSLDLQNLQRAKEALETARQHARTLASQAKVDTLAALLRENPPPSSQSGMASPENSSGSHPQMWEEFQVYLGSLETDVASLYAGLGTRFSEGYVALNSGDPATALQCFSSVEPEDEATTGLMAFEQARALLLLEQWEDSLLLMDVAASIRGSQPIFINNHPSISFLRAEALLAQNRPDDAVLALQAGLKSHPDQTELRLMLASLSIGGKDLDQAETLLNQELQCHAKLPEVHLLRARLFLARSNPALAEQALEAGMKHCGCSPSSLPHPSLARALCDLHLTSGTSLPRVEELLNQLFATQKGDVDWSDFYLRARLYKLQGRDTLAQEHFHRALEAIPEDEVATREKVRRLFQGVTAVS